MRIVLPDEVVVGFIDKCEREHTLFFEVSFVDTRKRFDQYCPNAQVTRLIAACSREEPSP